MACKDKDIGSFFTDSSFHMADVSAKQQTFRRAVAMGRIYVGKMAFQKIKEGTLPKGDVLKLAEIAGIMGAKNTSQLIPLCHPLSLDHVAVHYKLEQVTCSVVIYCLVATYAKTGVEMEALAGVNAALLTLYDLTKPVEPALTISDIRLLVKEGGKKGVWIHPDGIPPELKQELNILLPSESKLPLDGIKVAIITLSDRASKGEYKDKSGEILQKSLVDLGAKIIAYKLIADEASQLENEIKSLLGSKATNNIDLIITTGGTGMSPRDITPETIEGLCDKIIPGIGELLRISGAKNIHTAWLSRSVAGIIGKTLIVSLPGSTGGVKDGVEALKNILSHALKHVQNKSNIHQEYSCSQQHDQKHSSSSEE